MCERFSDCIDLWKPMQSKGRNGVIFEVWDEVICEYIYTSAFRTMTRLCYGSSMALAVE